jgi:hypothetical protein
MKRRVVTLKLTDVSEVRTAPIRAALIVPMMEAARISETSVNFNVIVHGPTSQKTLTFVLDVVRI